MTIEPLDSTAAPDGLEPLRRAFARVPDDGPGALTPVESCPEPDTVWAAVHRELPPAEIEAIVLHTARCAPCAEEWRLAREIGDRAEVDGAPSGIHQTTLGRSANRQRADRTPDTENWANVVPRTLRLRRFAAPLAGLAVAAAVVLMVGRAPDGPTPEERPISEIRAGAQVTIESEIAPGAVLDRQAFRLTWDEIPGATYDLLVSDTDLAVVAEASDLEDPTFTVPAESLARLASGAELYWQVEARLRDGTGQRSPTFVVRLE